MLKYVYWAMEHYGGSLCNDKALIAAELKLVQKVVQPPTQVTELKQAATLLAKFKALAMVFIK